MKKKIWTMLLAAMAAVQAGAVDITDPELIWDGDKTEPPAAYWDTKTIYIYTPAQFVGLREYWGDYDDGDQGYKGWTIYLMNDIDLNNHNFNDYTLGWNDDNKFGGFAPYWAGVIPRWAQVAEKENQPLAKLEELCTKGYNELFRQVGAVQFYEGKTASREQHAQEICDRVEHYIFDQWKTGDLSLYNMLQLIDCISSEVSKKRKNMGMTCVSRLA